MDFKDLSQFIVLADTLHYGQAAQKCHTSASTISRVVQKLEEEVGQRLFERDRRDVRLTQAGAEFKEFSLRTLDFDSPTQRINSIIAVDCDPPGK